MVTGGKTRTCKSMSNKTTLQEQLHYIYITFKKLVKVIQTQNK